MDREARSLYEGRFKSKNRFVIKKKTLFVQIMLMPLVDTAYVYLSTWSPLRFRDLFRLCTSLTISS
jgi:hypothetical protein